METELKFQLATGAFAAVRRAVATPTARHIQLRAAYHDTPDRRLAAAGIALRLRLEDEHWVQTVKAAGPNAIVRFEHEVALDPAEREPRIDIGRHAGTPVGKALAAALGGEAASLHAIFETNVQRCVRVLRVGAAAIEVALDVGEVIAGPRRLPLCEIEFELLHGPLEALLTLTERWVRRHGLWLDVRSKAERGHCLAQGLDAMPPPKARRPVLQPNQPADTALRTIVDTCLAQVLPCAAAVAGGVGSAEHLHHLRVGLRRLRCALQVFGDWSEATQPAWSGVLRELFQRLGRSRDRDVLAASVLPELHAAGAPLAELPDDPVHDDPGAALRERAWSALALQLIGFAQGGATQVPGATPPRLASLAQPRLRRMRRQLRDAAANFQRLDDAERHRSRKRLKRLRYSLEFVATLYTPKSVRQCLDRVLPAQELMGRYNDLAVAEQAFSALLAHDPRAGFAVGWLRASRQALVLEAGKAIAKAADGAAQLRPLRARAGKRKRAASA